MTSLPKLVLRELVASLIFGGYMYLYTKEPDWIRCMCYVPISIIALSRFILHMLNRLKTDIYCGLTQSWMLTFMNIPCFIMMFYLFTVDFIINFQDSVPQPVLVGLKSYMVLLYMMYARYYCGFFNLELQFSFLPIILEAIITGFVWDQTPDQTHEQKIGLVTLAAFSLQVIIYVIVFPKQTKDIVPLINLPYFQEAKYRDGSKTPENKTQPASNKKKSKSSKKND